jgi:hypothetical protein
MDRPVAAGRALHVEDLEPGDIARPRDLLLGPGRAIRRFAPRGPRGVAVLPCHGRGPDTPSCAASSNRPSLRARSPASRDGIRANARRVVEDAASTGGGDFVELIAKRLPLITISDMIGVPEADRERVVEAADVLVTLAVAPARNRPEPVS